MWMYVRKNPIEVQTLPYLGNDVDQHGKVKKEVAVYEKRSMGKIRYQSHQKIYQGYIYIYVLLSLLFKIGAETARYLEYQIISKEILE